MRKVTGCVIPQTPHIALLKNRVEWIPKHTQALLFYMLLGAKMTIAHAWKQPTISVSAAKRKMSWIMTQEKLVGVLQDKRETFEHIWKP